MKKICLVIFTFVPFLVGYIVNISIKLPVIGSVFFLLCPYLQRSFGSIWADSMPAVPGKPYLPY